MLLLCALSSFCHAAVFGDSNSLNGVEDQRLPRQEIDQWPRAFSAVGRLFCADQVQGSAVLLSLDDPEQKTSFPLLLTAQHLLQGKVIEDCLYAPQKDPLRRVAIDSIIGQGGETLSALEAAQPVVTKYATDWVLLRLRPWSGWTKHAIQADFPDDSVRTGEAHLVAFDLLTDTIMVHANCQFGHSSQSEILRGHESLYWDNCDSLPGASGGGLFVQVGGAYKLAGIRVGSLFNESLHQGQPQIGSEFDLHSNINVTFRLNKAIFSKMLDAVCTFTEMGCEPVGNINILDARQP